MEKIKVLIIFGTRPEAIKLAPLIRQMSAQTEVELCVCSTGQHKELLQQVINFFKITVDYDLQLMQRDQNLVDLSSQMLVKLNNVMIVNKPDLVLVHGDTTTTFVATWAAFYNKIKIGHVEAGLRTDSISSPWPEEANRRLTSALANFHFAPTQGAKDNLLRENIKSDSIKITGNTAIDSLLMSLADRETGDRYLSKFFQDHPQIAPDKSTILVTGHRRENFGQGIQSMCNALLNIVHKSVDTQIVFPVHPNPNVKKTVENMLGGNPNIHLTEALDYPTFINLMNFSSCIITDSGGIQEEAPSLQKHVFITRDTTERMEAVSAGLATLVGTNEHKIVEKVLEELSRSNNYGSCTKPNPYGDGKASERIVNFILKQQKWLRDDKI
ncbi:UDP-N-acetylglucosamine 2-epimerase (non-hydrolyzing) [Planktomarina temperata]|nr:UDP-N-acetylglucosamine 2-epimerase (non-hydrolyzing) [Planktomarina temperata]